MSTDPEFFELGQAFPSAFPLLAGATGAGTYQVTSQTVKRIERRIDLVLQPLGADEPWWQVECVDYRDAGIERTALLEGALLAQQLGLWGRLRTMIVYTREEYASAAQPATLDPAGVECSLVPVRVILEQIEPEELLARGVELFPLLPMTHVDWERLAHELPQWWRRLKDHLGAAPGQAARLRRLFVRFLVSRHSGVTLEKVNPLFGDKTMLPIEKTRLGQDLIDLGKKEGIDLGKREGIDLGKREGIDLGKKEGIEHAILHVVESRFGACPAELKTRLADCEITRLDAVLRAAACAPTLEEFLEGRW